MLHWRQWSEPSGDVWHLPSLLVLQETIWFVGACNGAAWPVPSSLPSRIHRPSGSEEQVQGYGGTDAEYLICVSTAWGSLSTSLTLLLSWKPWQVSSGEVVNPCLAAFCLQPLCMGSVVQSLLACWVHLVLYYTPLGCCKPVEWEFDKRT